MQYAESMLLGGQLISAEEVDKETYDELICVCPHSKKKVELVSYPSSTLPGYEKLPFIFTWVHSEKIPQTELDECNEKNKYYESQTYITDEVAKMQRINLLKPNLIKLIKSSAIFEQPATIEGLGDVWENDLIKWFAERFEHFTFNGMFQDTAKLECKNLYDNCIKQALSNKNHWISLENTDNFTTHNHLTYGAKIASEMLEYALCNFDAKDRRILIYWGTNEAVQESMQQAAFSLSNLVNISLTGKEKSDFWQLWEEDKYQAMNKVKQFAQKNPDFCVLYNKYTKNILYQFTINIALIFWFILWLDELKRLNQHFKPNNIC